MSRTNVPSRNDSPFSTLDTAFRLVAAGPSPLSVDGRAIGGLPNRPVPLLELRRRLLDARCRHATRDAAVTAVLTRAQAEGGAWIVGLAGLLLPGLARAARPLTRACPDRVDDVEAEMLTGLIQAAQATRPDAERVAARLVWAARRAAEHVVRAELAERARPGLPHNESAAPPRPYGHPDLVLAEAVALGVLDADQAELIGATRLGEISVHEAADQRGITYWAVVMRRRRAEQALTDWLKKPRYRRVISTPENPGSSGARRLRHPGRPDRRPRVQSEQSSPTGGGKPTRSRRPRAGSPRPHSTTPGDDDAGGDSPPDGGGRR